jgi:hypothetical protein
MNTSLHLTHPAPSHDTSIGDESSKIVALQTHEVLESTQLPRELSIIIVAYYDPDTYYDPDFSTIRKVARRTYLPNNSAGFKSQTLFQQQQERYSYIIEILDAPVFQQDPIGDLKKTDETSISLDMVATKFLVPFFIFRHTYDPDRKEVTIECSLTRLRKLIPLFVLPDTSDNAIHASDAIHLTNAVLKCYPELDTWDQSNKDLQRIQHTIILKIWGWLKATGLVSSHNERDGDSWLSRRESSPEAMS